MAEIFLHNGVARAIPGGSIAISGNCCCQRICCCVDGVLHPQKIFRDQCLGLGGTEVGCTCLCPECVPTVTFNGIDLTDAASQSQFAIVGICDRTDEPPFGWPISFTGRCVTNPSPINKIRAWAGVSWVPACYGNVIQAVTVEFFIAATPECDRGFAPGDFLFNNELTVDGGVWSRTIRFFFQGSSGDGPCSLGSDGLELITTEIVDQDPNGGDDLSTLAASSQECYDLLLQEPTIAIECGSELVQC